MVWNKISNGKWPIATESGPWDGLRSGLLLVHTRRGRFHVARMYQGVLRGTYFCDFFDEDGGEIHGVTEWTEIDRP